jgi:hypothetical protein
MPRRQFTLKALLWLMAGSEKVAGTLFNFGRQANATNACLPRSREGAKGDDILRAFAASRETPLPLLTYRSTTD